MLVLDNTFEEFNQKVFNQYINILEVEHRLRTETVKRDEFDWKMKCAYSDIKDLSYVLHDNYVEALREIELLKNEMRAMKEEIAQLKAKER